MNGTSENEWLWLEGKMKNLRCSDYGFECDFKAEGEIDHIITEFSKHTIDMHGIDYERDAIGQFIRRKYPKMKIQL